MALELNQVLPHDEIAEKALLGAMLVDNRYVNQVFSEISSDDFFRDSHILIAQAVLQLSNAGTAVDIITVSSLLEKEKKLKFVGGHAFVTSLVDDIPENLDIKEYIKIVKDRSTLRKIIHDLAGHHPEGSGPRRRHHQPAQRDAGRDHQDRGKPR